MPVESCAPRLHVAHKLPEGKPKSTYACPLTFAEIDCGVKFSAKVAFMPFCSQFCEIVALETICSMIVVI